MSGFPALIRQEDSPPSYQEINDEILPVIPSVNVPIVSFKVGPSNESPLTPINYIPQENRQASAINLQPEPQPTAPVLQKTASPKPAAKKNPRGVCGFLVLIIVIVILIVTNIELNK